MALSVSQIKHAIDQQERIAVRQNLQNLVDVEPGLRRVRRRFRYRDALDRMVFLKRFVSKRLEDYTVRLAPAGASHAPGGRSAPRCRAGQTAGSSEPIKSLPLSME